MTGGPVHGGSCMAGAGTRPPGVPYCRQKQVDNVAAKRTNFVSLSAGNVLHPVSQRRYWVIAHRRRHSFDVVDGSEDDGDRLGCLGVPLPLEQLLVDGSEVLMLSSSTTEAS